ncbi:MAG: ABC transporter ATP-binding protein [Anaerolineae bacterium]|nr:ABC transporter ATP-binding protein [Anaerolineae bacterium]
MGSGGQSGPVGPGGPGGPSGPSGAGGPGASRGVAGRGPMHGGARIERAKDVQGALRRLVVYFQPYRWALAAVLALVVINIAMDLVAPLLLGQAIDQGVARRDLAALLRTVLLLLGAYAGAWLTRVVQGVIMARVSQRAMRTLRRDLFQHLQTLSLSFFDRHPHGELMSRLTNDMDAINRVISMQVTELFSGLLSLIGVLVMMFALNFWLALASMVVLPLMVLLVALVGRRTRQGFRDYQMRLGQLNGQLEEIFSGQRVIIAFAQQESVLGRFEGANAAVRAAGIQAQSYALLIPPLMGILSNANIAVVVGVGAWMALRGLTSIGTIAAFISYSRDFANPLRRLGDVYNQVQSALAGAERIFQIIDEQPEISDAPDALPLAAVTGEVSFEGVCFNYVPGVPVIREMSFHARPGQTIALVGPTGAGKTTMINLLTRFYDIGCGAIRIDGLDIRKLKKDDLRRQLGIVLQDTFLFSDSVMENIRYGRLDATDEEVIAAAQLANAHQFIARLPEGYATPLSERGSNLSQGQRQLLAIARAVLADPGILILDEATSSVDTRTEVHIQEALLRLMEGRTSFVIAHRLSTIRDADEILVINAGRIVERGNHEALMAQRGFYHGLYVSQFKGRAAEFMPDASGARTMV